MTIKTKPNTITICAILLQVVFAITTIFFAYRSLNAPKASGEFNLLKNAATEMYAMTAMVFGFILLLCAVFLYKLKGWAYVTSIIVLLLSIPVLALGQLYGWVFEMAPGAALSATGEILPVVVLVLHAIGFKNFKRT